MTLLNRRLIARLDVKGQNLIKGIHLEGLRKIGDPQEYASKYYEQGADELIYMDIVASLYGRRILDEVVKRAAQNIFVPLTVGGGVRSTSDVDLLLKSGADKVAINTAAVKNPNLISEVSNRFGSQCMVLSIEAKKQNAGNWEVYTDCGRERSGLDVAKWAQQAVDLGAGELMITSIDREGTSKGFDQDLLSLVSGLVKVPIIISGGYGQPQDIVKSSCAGADGIAIAKELHYKNTDLKFLREFSLKNNIPVRTLD